MLHLFIVNEVFNVQFGKNIINFDSKNVFIYMGYFHEKWTFSEKKKTFRFQTVNF